MFELEEKNPKYAVNISDKPVTFKQSQGHHTYNDNVKVVVFSMRAYVKYLS